MIFGECFLSSDAPGPLLPTEDTPPCRSEIGGPLLGAEGGPDGQEGGGGGPLPEGVVGAPEPGPLVGVPNELNSSPIPSSSPFVAAEAVGSY